VTVSIALSGAELDVTISDCCIVPDFASFYVRLEQELIKRKQNYHESGQLMNRSKIVAIITGVISLALAIGYLLLVQLLDFRGEMVPAPVGQLFYHSLLSFLN
jgi:hypothetical protein